MDRIDLYNALRDMFPHFSEEGLNKLIDFILENFEPKERKNMNIAVREYRTATFVFDEDYGWRCSHAEAYIDPACCDGSPSEGRMTCGCEGRDAVFCPAIDCTGVEDWEIEDLFERIAP